MQKLKGKKPLIRFSEFNDDWELLRIDELIQRESNPVIVRNDVRYGQIGIRSHGKGIFHKESILGKNLGSKRVFWVRENALVLNIVFAWEHAIAITSRKELGMIASHRFPMYIPLKNKSDINFLLQYFLTTHGRTLLNIASPGGAGRNKTLGQKEFESLKIYAPEKNEQKKIASFLSEIDSKIAQLVEKKSLLYEYQKGIMQSIFSRKIRFKDSKGHYFSDWEKRSLGELLDYEQPTKYIVNTTEYDDQFPIPVLTAGKSFILGYTNESHGIYENNLPVIIFDDFTTGIQLVDFPFKVKSSAIKILRPKKNVNIYFVYEAMKHINYSIVGHERHWISKYSKIEISVPKPEEQIKISDFLATLTQKIAHVTSQIEGTKLYKKGLTQKILC